MTPGADPDRAVLERCGLFAGIDSAELDAMLACLDATRREYVRAEYLYRMGEPLTSVGVVLAGNVHIVQEDYWGNHNILANVEKGGIFGEAFASAQVTELPVSVLAATGVRVLQIDYRRIVTTCSSACGFHTRLVRNMMGILAANNVRLTLKIEHVTRRTTRDKVLSYLSEQARLAKSDTFAIPFNRQELADYLAVDRSALSAELSRMQADGLLSYDRNKFRLL